jgi:SAM-dependent methyltransferase
MTHQHVSHVAADLAATAALLQIGAELGVDQALDSGTAFSAASLAQLAHVPEEAMAGYLTALAAAGLVVNTGLPGEFQAAPDYADRRYASGYLSWALSANGPLIENARQYFLHPVSAAAEYRRDGRRVAVSSRWIGERAFYPVIVGKIVSAGATRVADLGAGAAGLLIGLLQQDSARSGVAVDISAAACAAAREAAARAGVGDRLEVAERSVESLVDEAGPIKGVEAIHAGFVMHDIAQDDVLFGEVLRTCREALAPQGFMTIADAIPYAEDEHERQFSALFTYLHSTFMGVRLPTAEKWTSMLYTAGFSNVELIVPMVPGGRIFVATR